MLGDNRLSSELGQRGSEIISLANQSVPALHEAASFAFGYRLAICMLLASTFLFTLPSYSLEP